MTLCEVAVQKKVSTIMMITGLVLLGLIAITRLPQELYPRVTFPQLTVVTNYLNAAPEETETLITKPIEEAVGSVSGLKGIQSISREGKSVVTVSFDWGVDIDFAALALREKIDLVKEKLPKECEDPVVLKFDPLAHPILILSLTGPLSPVDLKNVAEKTVKDNLEKVLGVASADISGGLDREILVEVDQGRIHASKLSLLTIVDSLEKSNLSYPAGSIKKGLFEYLIRTMGEFKSVEEIGYAVAGVDKTYNEERLREDVFVERAKFGPRDTLEGAREFSKKEKQKKRLILFKEIADINDTFKEKTSISRYNGKENISISIQKQADANVIQVVDRIKEALVMMQEELDARDVTLEIIYDQSLFIRKSLEDVRDAGLQGGVLAFLVLLAFLRNFYASFIVIVAIPTTVMGVFFLMFATGITINTMSMGGLALGVGMLIDNGVVVTENIFRMRKQEGLNAEDAAIKGSNEVIWAMLSSTLTTCAVFFPLLVFVPGVAGQLFRDLSWSVIYSQLLSWAISLTLTPLLALSIKIKDMGDTEDETKYKPLKFEGYFKNLPVGKQHSLLYKIVAVAFVSFVIGVVILSKLDKEVLPKVDQGQFIIKVNMPVGTKLDVTDEVATALEKVILGLPDVENTALSVGSSRKGGAEGGVAALRSSQAQILVNLKTKRKHSSAQVVDDLKNQVKEMHLQEAEVEYVLQESEFQVGEASKPISIEIQGYDYEVMTGYMKTLEKMLGGLTGVYGIQNDLSKPSPETKVEIDRRKAALYGVSVRDISLTVKTAIDGAVPTKFKEAGQEYDIRVQLRKEDRDNLMQLGELLIHSPVLDSEVPLKEVARIVRGFGPSEIKRKDQSRTIVVSANIEQTANKQGILDSVSAFLKENFKELPEGYSIQIGGEAVEVKEAFSKIVFALVLSIALTYMIMASQFESLMQPFVIMFTVPLSVIGVAVALYISHTSLNAISLLGFILLGGVVVNNGIVLIEYVNQRRATGEDLVTAAIRTSHIRCRPICMTAVSSIVGSVPLAFGIGTDQTSIQAPMAIATIGGLFSSTLLTLFVIPSIYILVERFMEGIFSRFYGEEEEEAEPNLESPA